MHMDTRITLTIAAAVIALTASTSRGAVDVDGADAMGRPGLPWRVDQ